MNATTTCSFEVGEDAETLLTAPVPPPTAKVHGRGRAARRINFASSLGMVLGAYGAPGSILLTLFLLEGLRADKWQIGLVLTMTYLGPTFEPVGAYLVERFGRRRPLFLAGFLVNRLPFFVFALIPLLGPPETCRGLGLGLVFAVVAVTRVGAHLATPAWWTWVADLVPERRRARFFGCRTQSASAVTAASMVVGLTLLHLGGGLTNARLVSALFAAGALFGLIDILLYLGVPEPPFKAIGNSQKLKEVCSSGLFSFLREFRAPFRESTFRRLILGMGLWSFSANLVLPFVPVYQCGEMLAGRHLGLGISFLSLAGLSVLASLATMLTSRKWADWAPRLGTRSLVLLGSGYLFVNLAYGFIGPVSMALLIPVVLVGGVLIGAWTVSTNQLLLAVAPRTNRSYYVSAYNFTNGWLMAGGPLLGGLLADHLPVLGWVLPGGLPCCYFHLLLILASAGGVGALIILAGLSPWRLHQTTPADPLGKTDCQSVLRREIRWHRIGVLELAEMTRANGQLTSDGRSPINKDLSEDRIPQSPSAAPRGFSERRAA
jgi:MFS family permease